MYRIGQVAAQLDISPSTLRRWSDRYAAWLSEEGGNPELLESGRRATRMYSDEDLHLLEQLCALKADGLSEEEIEQRFQQAASDPNGAGTALVRRGDGGEALQVLQQAVDAQQAIITAQHAQRDLLNAVIGDALELKDENERLRRRVRMMEEEVSRLKESDWNHRLALEERMAQLEREMVEEKQARSWWERLLGR